MKTNEDSQKVGRLNVAIWLIRVPVHLIGLMAVAALTAMPFMNQLTLNAIWESVHHRQFLAIGWPQFIVHLGLAACLWALVVLAFQVITAKRQPVRRLLKLERGSVMTETLIIFPVFLMLTFGIAQLAVNNVAGLVANAAGFQAGRTYWLWYSEAKIGRNGVTSSLALEMAHVQAAAVMTPVAPEEFKLTTGGLSEQAEQMRALLLGEQIPLGSRDTGANARTVADTLVALNNSKKSGRDSTFVNALGTHSWRARTVRQFTFAYHAIKITEETKPGEIGVRMVYSHHQAFPLVARIFGEGAEVGGRRGFYSKITRVFTMPEQIHPNSRPF